MEKGSVRVLSGEIGEEPDVDGLCRVVLCISY